MRAGATGAVFAAPLTNLAGRAGGGVGGVDSAAATGVVRVVEVDGWENELFLLRCREDLVEVDGHAEGDKEETPDAGFDPVLRL